MGTDTGKRTGDVIRLALRAAGRVQHVGFRYFATGLARRHGVTGWVRNLADGSVALEVQGTPGRVDAFLDDLCTPLPNWSIRVVHLERRALPPVDSEKSFVVRR